MVLVQGVQLELVYGSEIKLPKSNKLITLKFLFLCFINMKNFYFRNMQYDKEEYHD